MALTMDHTHDSFFAASDAIVSSKSRRPSSSLSLRSNLGRYGSKKLGRTKSLLLLGRTDTSTNMDPLSIEFNESATTTDEEVDDSMNTRGGSEQSEHQLQARHSSLRYLLNRTGISFKSRTSKRDQSMTHRIAEASRLQRLRHAVGFRISKCEPVQEHENHDVWEMVKAPIPGNGNVPPIIPEAGGMAARANAAASILLHWRSTLTFEDMEDSQGDRESGIGITTAASTSSLQQDSSVPDSVTRVDFMQRLPCELTSQVLSHLNLQDMRAVELVSRRWNLVASDPYVWRDVFYRDKSGTVATGMPIVPGTGHGLPYLKPSKDWRKVYKARQQLERNWNDGYSQATYLHGHQDSIYCLQFDENKIVSGSRDKTIRVWDIETFQCILVIGCPTVIEDLEQIENTQGKSTHSATQPDKDNKDAPGRSIAFCKPKKLAFPTNHNASILCLQYDDEILVTGSSDATCIVHDIQNGYTPTMQLEGHALAILDLAFDRNHIVTCSKDTTICVWERTTGKLLKQLRGHTGPVNAIQLRGNSVVSCSGDTVVKLWNIDTGRLVREFTGHSKGLACSQFSDDAKLIASAGNDRTIRIWNANSGELIREIDAHENLVRSLHIDSVSGRLVSGSYDQDIKVWNIITGNLMLDFPKWHASWVLGAKSDYRRIISTGQDPKILIMDFGHGVDGVELLESTPRSAARAKEDRELQEQNMPV